MIILVFGIEVYCSLCRVLGKLRVVLEKISVYRVVGV